MLKLASRVVWPSGCVYEKWDSLKVIFLENFLVQVVRIPNMPLRHLEDSSEQNLVPMVGCDPERVHELLEKR